ncbi:MAG TPA: YhbY family RNA-binding protein [Methanomassiliicoccales archaeon]|nr:YhbY family RNA-binding protein [Methanomassiliicoccales archaeon]
MREASELEPTIHVGKDGITEPLVEEVKAQLKNRKVVKVRLLPAAGEDKKGAAMRLAESASATMVDLRGSVVVLSEKRYFGGKKD